MLTRGGWGAEGGGFNPCNANGIPGSSTCRLWVLMGAYRLIGLPSLRYWGLSFGSISVSHMASR